MTIAEYKEKFIELAKQLEEEHGPIEQICINADKHELGGALDRKVHIFTTLSVEINF